MEKGGMRNEDGRPQFFKIIHGEDVLKHLRIPPAFLKVLAEDMSDSATLECYSGGQRRVAVRKHVRGTYFEDGWEEFMTENKLGDDEFLVFRYDGNMNFYVKIFQKNGVIRSDTISDTPEEEEKEEEEEEEEAATRGSEKRSRGRPRKYPNEWGGSHKRSRSKSVNFTSKFPFFERYMTKPCVQRSFVLSIPRGFSSVHLPQKKTMVVLRNSAGETWDVKCNFHGGAHCLSGGWSAFVRANRLRLGYTCIFELVEETVFQVHISSSD